MITGKTVLQNTQQSEGRAGQRTDKGLRSNLVNSNEIISRCVCVCVGGGMNNNNELGNQILLLNLVEAPSAAS